MVLVTNHGPVGGQTVRFLHHPEAPFWSAAIICSAFVGKRLDARSYDDDRGNVHYVDVFLIS